MKRISIIALAVLFSASSSGMFSQGVSAADGRNWRAGNIIDDALFTDRSSMSVGSIQNWLNSRLSCDTNGTQPSELGGGIDYNNDGTVTRAEYGKTKGNPAPFTCLNNYYEIPKTTPGSGLPASNYGKSTIPSGAKSAAQLIYDAAQAYNISPKVLLVKLGTESAGPLTSDTWPFYKQYIYAMGAHCPDSGPGGSANCDSNYAGFSLQMREAAKLLRWYLDSMTQSWWTYKKPRATNHILWNVQETGCGGSNVYIENNATAALYTYTPYQPNSAALNNLYGTGDGCSAYGNRNFWRVFNDWFGSTRLPSAIKGTSSSTVYMQSDGYKFSVPSMAMLQDYGINPNAVKTISNSSLASIPSPASPLDSNLGYLVKSPSDSDVDGGSVYLVSIGKRYKVRDLAQMTSYGLSTSDIKYIPLSMISALPNGGYLANFVATPTNNVFKADSGGKRIIFEGSLYNSLNPSGAVSRISLGTSYAIPSGNPLASKPISIQKATGAVYVYLNTSDSFYSVKSMDEYNCWGINSTSQIPMYRLANSTYVSGYASAPAVSCAVHDTTSGASFVLNGKTKLSVPAGVTVASQDIGSDLSSVIAKLPTRSTPLSSLVKSSSSATVYKLEGSLKRRISTYRNLTLLGYPSTHLDTIDNDTVESIPNGNLILGDGALVKASGSSAVYVVHDNSRDLIPTGEIFLALNNKWSYVETYSKVELDAAYPYTNKRVEAYLSTSDANKSYLVDSQGCKTIDQSTLMAYAKDRATFTPFDAATFRQLNPQIHCKENLSVYIKSNDSAAVYAIESGKKRQVSSWSALQDYSGESSPRISTVSGSSLSSIPSGSPL